jgi:hypothetical protein
MLEKRVDGLISNNTSLTGLSQEEQDATNDIIKSIKMKAPIGETTVFERFLSIVLYPIRDDFKGTGIKIPMIRELDEIARLVGEGCSSSSIPRLIKG